ncbi:MAG TPA: formyltransferase [Gammaproteobacteria bacterium]|nr:formyltransferase [Gammaproteobacteria bacterium]
MPTDAAVVFAYHNVGVRGLSVLLANKLDIRLLITHKDNSDENIWFDSVAELAAHNDIEVITPDDPNTPEIIEKIKACQPDWLFSFYYRHMLGADILAQAARGAYNLHGSLLPKYRGRVPINWAILNGERETGASLHKMEIKADAGPLIDQAAVAILANDTAHDVFQKVVCASEKVLLRSVPALLTGQATETPLDLSAGSYFSGRRPEDGRIDWNRSAWEIHNLIRAVAPPYPGAFFDIRETRLQILGSYYRGLPASGKSPRIYWENQRCWADCIDGKRLCLTRITIDNCEIDEAGFQQRFATTELPIT